jgi:hypothetical protein
MVRLDTRDGLHKQSLTIFSRGSFGGIKLSVWFFADVRSPFGKPELADWPCA